MSLCLRVRPARPCPVCARRSRHTVSRSRRRISARAVDTAESATYDQLEQISVDVSCFPQAQFFQVIAVVRPWRLRGVVSALSDQGIRGLTVTNVAGIGFQGGKERYGGTEFGESDLIEKRKIEIVCAREQVNDVARCVSVSAYTGEVGDGKIFILPVADIVRIRTAETGGSAERMYGGRTDILSSTDPDDTSK